MEIKPKEVSELFDEYFNEEVLSFLPQDENVRQEFISMIKYFFIM